MLERMEITFRTMSNILRNRCAALSRIVSSHIPSSQHLVGGLLHGRSFATVPAHPWRSYTIPPNHPATIGNLTTFSLPSEVGCSEASRILGEKDGPNLA